MKFYIFLLMPLLLLACKQKEGCFDEELNQGEARIDCGGPCAPCAVEYPEFGDAGNNILFGKDTLVIGEAELALTAIIPSGSSLNAELRLLSGEPWSTESNVGWTINKFVFDRQLFFAPDEGMANLTLVKSSTLTDTLLVRYFENNSSETQRKIVIWE